MKSLLLFLLFLPLSLLGQEEDTTIYDFPEVEAQFPGGPAEMQRFVINNIDYPDTVIAEPPSKIYFSFVVEKDGALSNIEIIKPIDLVYQAHFMEFLMKMPDWIPAQVKGKNVRSRYRLPIIICYN